MEILLSHHTHTAFEPSEGLASFFCFRFTSESRDLFLERMLSRYIKKNTHLNLATVL